MARPHYHVHSYIPGYLCECDSHYAYRTRAEADAELRWERNSWRDYAADQPAEDPIHFSGSIRSGRFDYTAGIAWWRASERWQCSEPECLTETEN